MYGRRSKWLQVTKYLYLLFVFGIFLYAIASGLAADAAMMAYCLFRNVNALIMFFIQPIFFWYPPRCARPIPARPRDRATARSRTTPPAHDAACARRRPRTTSPAHTAGQPAHRSRRRSRRRLTYTAARRAASAQVPAAAVGALRRHLRGGARHGQLPRQDGGGGALRQALDVAHHLHTGGGRGACRAAHRRLSWVPTSATEWVALATQRAHALQGPS